MEKDEVKYISLCNDDDIWLPNHLETLAIAYQKWPKASFIYTRGNHLQMGDLPTEEIHDVYYNNKPVTEHDTLFSSVSWKLNEINLRFKNCVKEKIPADADLWIRMKEYFLYKKLNFLYIPKITVLHESHKPNEDIQEEVHVENIEEKLNYSNARFKSKRDLLF